jgi:alpha-aminoadipic semialdehyde synthase
MINKIGIRREDKNKWEKRVPIIPKHVKKLNDLGIEVIIQPSKIRAYSDKEFQNAGAIVREDLSDCQTIFAVKEIPVDFFNPKKTYLFFSHTIKGQKYNMPMLKKMMELNCNLIDYERIVNEKGLRLLFFGRFAGIAGIIDTLWAYGQRLDYRKIGTPLNQIKQTINYKNLDEIKDHFKIIKDEIQQQGLPDSIAPLVIGIAGYGNVSNGVQEILDCLPVKNIDPNEIMNIYDNPQNDCMYKVVFKEKDMVEPKNSEKNFDLQDYYKNPNKYKSVFEKYIPYLSILMNCIYWDSKYPRLITKEYLNKNYDNSSKLKVIGDISIDINGAIEFSEKATSPDSPVYVYEPSTKTITDGFKGDGIVVMGVDNLPCELPQESSASFSNVLHTFVNSIAKANFNVDFEDCILPPEIKNAVILYQGKLTSNYQYIDKYL